MANGKTAFDLGRLSAFNSSEFGKVSKQYSDAKPGKLAYMLEYRATFAPVAVAP